MDSAGLLKWAEGTKRYEGWAGPGEVLNGKQYPNGTPSYRNNNPGNFHYTDYVRSLGATHGTMSGFAVFPDLAAGEAALVQFLRDARDNELVQYRRYADRLEVDAAAAALVASETYHAKHKEVGAGFLCNLHDFYQVYAPTKDKNDPDKYAEWMARFLGCPESISIDDI